MKCDGKAGLFNFSTINTTFLLSCPFICFSIHFFFNIHSKSGTPTASPYLFAVPNTRLFTSTPKALRIFAATVMVCRKPFWHMTTDCEDSDKKAAHRLKMMKTDLFKKRDSLPAAQKEIMNRNASVSPFLRLPPEIRLRIYKFVLGGQRLWIDFHRAEFRYSVGEPYAPPTHYGGCFYHFNGIDRSSRLDIRVLRLCRQVFSETALLPYALNDFTFADGRVQMRFEKLVRRGKKELQKKAIGACSISPWSKFCSNLIASQDDGVEPLEDV